jgi:hypothetical protein
VTTDLDHWLPKPAIRVAHRRDSSASAEDLWTAARGVRLRDAGLLGRLVRWRIPGTSPELSFDELFRADPFVVLAEEAQLLVSGLAGRIWTLRRDYPRLRAPAEFLDWSQRGTAQVMFANWVQPGDNGGSMLCSEVRVRALGSQGRLGLAAVRPLIAAFHPLVGSDGIELAVRRAEGR